MLQGDLLLEKKQRRKKRSAAALAVHLLILVLEIIGTRLVIRSSPGSIFEFYTVDSNLFTAAVSLVTVFCLIRSAGTGEPLPYGVRLARYLSACCLGTTITVVVTVLAPTMSFGGVSGYTAMLLQGSMLYHHLLCPILSIFSLIVLEPEPPLRREAALQALIPTAVYAAVLFSLNLAGAVDGPYPFLRVRAQPVRMTILWAAVILGLSELIARILLILCRRGTRRFGAAA